MSEHPDSCHGGPVKEEVFGDTLGSGDHHEMYGDHCVCGGGCLQWETEIALYFKYNMEKWEFIANRQGRGSMDGT